MANFAAGALLASISCGFKLRGHFLPQLNLGCPETGGGEEESGGGGGGAGVCGGRVLVQLMVFPFLRHVLFTCSGKCG